MLSIEDIVRYRDFKKLCINFAKATKLRIMDVSIRALRNSMIQTMGTQDCVPKDLRTIFVSLKDMCKAKSKKKKKRGLVELDDIQVWLIPPTNGAVGQVRGHGHEATLPGRLGADPVALRRHLEGSCSAI
ncbi:hypothetical protein P3T76_013631 [Phytophthora citrophthora]|uniref:Uncharacterized protein n=1 Tax=Phytophthora citrophthora TaxID=4793 RepID=A0AAD9LD07_9STRA|nr:hypothetical protein P3T76_013631 [Phytophthora citrophthora]